MAKLSDVAGVVDAREAALELYQVDPDLEAPEHRQLRRHVAEFWGHVPAAS